VYRPELEESRTRGLKPGVVSIPPLDRLIETEIPRDFDWLTIAGDDQRTD
jgi:hypothetical protein